MGRADLERNHGSRGAAAAHTGWRWGRVASREEGRDAHEEANCAVGFRAGETDESRAGKSSAKKIGKEAERRGRDTEPDRKERKKQSRLDQDFGATILNLASQIDLPKLLELL